MTKDSEIFEPINQKDWREWLKTNHKKKDSVWVTFYKQGSETPNMSWSEAVDEALCFGWIDSTKKTIDDMRYKQYFSRRKPKSNWSKINKEKVASLIKSKRMAQAGLQSIAIAKENGSWTILDNVEALVVPNDLKKELANYPGATEFFDELSKSATKNLLYWVVSAKRDETRQKRILDIAQNASENLKPKQFR